jgi:hypothetical protein
MLEYASINYKVHALILHASPSHNAMCHDPLCDALRGGNWTITNNFEASLTTQSEAPKNTTKIYTTMVELRMTSYV